MGPTIPIDALGDFHLLINANSYKRDTIVATQLLAHLSFTVMPVFKDVQEPLLHLSNTVCYFPLASVSHKMGSFSEPPTFALSQTSYYVCTKSSTVCHMMEKIDSIHWFRLAMKVGFISGMCELSEQYLFAEGLVCGVLVVQLGLLDFFQSINFTSICYALCDTISRHRKQFCACLQICQ